MERGLRYLVAGLVFLGGNLSAFAATGEQANYFWISGDSPAFQWRPANIAASSEIEARNEQRRSWFNRAERRIQNSCRPIQGVKNLDLELQAMAYRAGQPEWLLQDLQSGRRFRLRFGAEIFAEAFGNCLHERLGYNVDRLQVEAYLAVALGKFSLRNLAKSWDSAREGIPWAWHFDKRLLKREFQSERTLQIRNALLEEMQPNEEFSERGSGWQSLRDSEWQRLSADPAMRSFWFLAALLENYGASHKLAFARDARGEPYIRRFNHSLGNRDLFSSPNLFSVTPFSDESEIKSAVENGDSLELKFQLDGPARALALQSDAHDIRLLIELLDGFQSEDYYEMLTAAAYPEKLALVYARKLRERFVRLARMLDFMPSMPSTKLSTKSIAELEDFREINDDEYIRDGVVIKNYPDFPLHLLDTSASRTIRKNTQWIFGKARDLAEEMIAHAPFLGVEKSFAKHWHAGPGWIFRLERKVHRNPDSTGAHDLYLVKDKLKVNLLFGIGVGGQFLKQTIWASGAPGYSRMYVYTHTAPTYAEGKAAQWKMIGGIWEKSDLSELAPGSTMAIREGYSANIIAGGNLKFGSRKLRGATYVMRSTEWVNGVQARHKENGDWQIIQEEGKRGQLGTKLYLRFLHRSLRVPIAHYRTSAGNSDYKIFELPFSSVNQFSDAKKLGWREALATRDFSAVLTDEQFRHMHTDYEGMDAEINLDFMRRKNSEGMSFVEWSRLNGEVERFWISKASTAVVFKTEGDFEQEACGATSIAVLNEERQTKLDSIAMHSFCRFEDDLVRGTEWQSNQERSNIASGLLLPEADIEAWLAKYPYIRINEPKVDWRTNLWFDASDLQPILDMDEETFHEIVSTSESANTLWGKISGGIVPFSRGIRHELREISVRNFWESFFAERDPLGRIKMLTQVLGSNRTRSLLRFLTLQLVRPSYLSRQISISAATIAGIEPAAQMMEPLQNEVGKRPKTKAARLLREWEELNEHNHLRSI